MRMKCLCVTTNGNVYEIPIKQIDANKVVKEEISNQMVLMVTLAYETENRKPYQLGPIWFERVVFDENGVYDFSDDHLSEKNHVLLEYAMSGITTGENSPLPIPPAPIIPSENESQAIKTYLNKKYPLLLKNSPDAINNSIRRSKQIHEENIKKLKKSHKST
ncbi:hypothetical protein [Bacillus sp. REN16]|uniref:hypothetical protein n=1 Tax=Bacillus sp. REN16 TaxID=2887296 RepID=UPI001E37203E|nr:hypothetical protein [Bacillus sp. REN16]MCC3357757.1 hypothetical protein [Bacillus sp. REN16]